MSRRGGGDRTPEQREAARRERERRRYEKAGEPVPDHLLEPHERAAAPSDPEPAAFEPFEQPPADPAPPAHEPEPSFFDEPAPRPEQPPADPAPPAHEPEPSFFDEPAPRPEEPAFLDEPAPAPPREEPAERTPPAQGERAFFDEPVAHRPDPPAAAEPRQPAEPEHDPQATQQWDVTESWLDDVESRPSQERARQEPPPPSTPEPARKAERRSHEPEPPVPSHDPDATQAHDALAPQHDEPAAPAAAAAHAAGDPHATQAHDVTSGWTREHDALDPPSEEHEAPLGTKRVSGRDRLPHIHRPGRGGGDKPRRGRGVRVKRPGEVAGGGSLRRRRSLAGRIAAVVVLAIFAALVWFLVSLFQPIGGGGDGTGSVTVRVPQGATAGEIGDLLAERGVVPSSFFFGIRAGLSGERSNLKSGTFRLREDMSYAAAIEALTRVTPPPPVVTVAIPEGRSRRETVPIARRAGMRGDYLTASRRSAELNPRRYGAPADATLEGFLFPATYEVPRGANVRRLVTDQLRAFKANLAGVDLRHARSKNLSVFDVLTIASMVEREVSVARERPLVAAVIYNRLRDGIPLGIDATLRFEQNDWVNPLRQSVLDADTPFNTRTRQGLPPGPIGSPGLASIEAAANPARSRALYYVVKPNTCGEHAFSETFEQFQLDVARYNQAREAAGGRSPTSC